MNMNFVALIPARAGSTRVPGKNMRLLGGHPLVALTIAAAQQSGVFSDVLVSTDDANTGFLASERGARYMSRPADFATDTSPDIDWVRHTLQSCPGANAFAILRPTSPFRTAATIRRALKQFQRSEVHSIRAVQPASEHPGKMWTWQGPGYPMRPFVEQLRDGTPWHSLPTQTLPTVYVQNASLEIAWAYVVTSFGTISGTKIAPFFTEGYEGFDINTEEDFARAEALVASGAVSLPTLSVAPPL